MSALKEMEVRPRRRPLPLSLLQRPDSASRLFGQLIWGSAIRQWELLHGLVDLRDADLRAELDERAQRGTKRATMDLDEAAAAPGSAAFDGVRPTNFHHRPIQGSSSTARTTSKPGARKRSSTSTSRRSATSGAAASGSPPLPAGQTPLFPGPAALHSPPLDMFGPGSGAHNLSPMFSGAPMQGVQLHGHAPGDSTPQSFDILNPQLDLSQFRSRPGSSSGATNFSDLCVPPSPSLRSRRCKN